MDSRCPLKLKHFPAGPCSEGHRAVVAARARKPHVGCPYFVNDAGSNYCAFKYMAKNEGREAPVSEIAVLLLCTEEEVKAALASALAKMCEGMKNSY